MSFTGENKGADPSADAGSEARAGAFSRLRGRTGWFLGPLAVCLAALAAYFAFMRYAALADDYARLMKENGQLEAMLAAKSLASDNDAMAERYERWSRWMLERFKK